MKLLGLHKNKNKQVEGRAGRGGTVVCYCRQRFHCSEATVTPFRYFFAAITPKTPPTQAAFLHGSDKGQQHLTTQSKPEEVANKAFVLTLTSRDKVLLPCQQLTSSTHDQAILLG